MARGIVPVERVWRFSLLTDPRETTGDPTNGHVIANDGATMLVLRNITSGGPTVSVLVPVGYDQNLTAGPRIYTLSASATSYTGVFPVEFYGPQLMVDVSSSNVRIVALSLLGT